MIAEYLKDYVQISIGEPIDPRQDYTTTLRIPVTIHRKRLRKAVQVYHEVVSCTPYGIMSAVYNAFSDLRDPKLLYELEKALQNEATRK